MKVKSIWILLLFVSCNMGPKYEPPKITFSDNWSLDQLDPEIAISPEVNLQWWEVFNDPLLNQYIDKAAKNNHDLLAAQSRILEARALKQVAASQFFPQISGDLNGSKTYFSKNGPVFAGQSLLAGATGLTGLPFGLQFPQIEPLYNILLDASWEIDFFGKVQNSVIAAAATIEKRDAEKNAILLTLLAEVARNYIDLRTSQQAGKLVEEDLRFLQEQVAIQKEQFLKGYHNKIDLEGIEAELAEEQALLPQIYAEIYASIYALSNLVGEAPEALLTELLPLGDLPPLPENVTVGLRSDLLRRRPDVKEAERQIAIATAQVGIAVASFFPTVSLGANLGIQSLKLINLFQSRSKTWSYGGGGTLPIFQGGQLVGNLRATQASAVTATENYGQVVLNALEEAESNLVRYESRIKELSSMSEVVDKTGSIVMITEQQLEKGLITKTELLDSERTLNKAERNLLQSQSNALLGLVSLYKALGGGWESFEKAN